MATCINRDLSLGVDRISTDVLDWLNTRTCQQKKSFVAHLSVRPPDVRSQANKLDIYLQPGFVRLEGTTARMTRLGAVQSKWVYWGGPQERRGHYVNVACAPKPWWAIFSKWSPSSATLFYFYKKRGTKSFPVTVRHGIGVTHFRRGAPNIQYGVGFSFPRSLTTSLCADVYRRWTASVSYMYADFVACARFAGNMATRADSVFELGMRSKIPKLFDILSNESTAHFSWTVDGLALGATLLVDSGQVPGYRQHAERVGGGMPISFSVSVLWPIGQPLGSVESLPFQGGGKFQLFFGIDQAPWIGRNNLPDEILDDDPLGILPRHGPSKLYDV